MEKAAAVTLILTVLLILLRGKCAGVEVYGAFLSGAKKGMEAAWQLLPALTGMLLMLSLMNASGLTALLVRLLSPLTAILNLPQEVAPMLILRPMTGSGSLAVLQEIFAQYGADSRVGRIASVLMGSSETIFYTMSVYLGAASDFGGTFVDSMMKMIERAVVAAKREGVISDTHREEGAVAGAAHDAVCQVSEKAMGFSVGGKIGVARSGEHVAVAVFFTVGLVHLNEVVVGMGHRAI